MQGLGANSKLNADWEFLRELCTAGQQSATAWLAGNFRHLGERSSVDLDAYL
jgi:NTE family protein